MKKNPFAHLVKSGLIEFSSKKRLEDTHRQDIIRLAQTGHTIPQIARELKIGTSTVFHALNNFGARVYLTHEQIKKFKLRPAAAPPQKPKKPQNPKKT
jgi:DNA-binding CsgD family transcriptional regulator